MSLVQRCGFVLVPGFGLGALAGAVDVLQAAGALLAGADDQPPYAITLLTIEPGPVAAAGGVQVAAQPLADAAAFDLLVIVAAAPPPPQLPAVLQAALLQAEAAGRLLGGIDAGAAWLAAADLLAGRRTAVHWPLIAPLAQRHPELLVSQRLFEIDGPRLTCAGRQASRDLMIAWLAQRHGARFAQELAAQLGLEHVTRADENQRAPLGARLAASAGGGSAKLAEAVALMEANLGEPLPTEEIARLVGVSRRQLERLFKQHLDALPARWYLGLRLERARRALRQTSQSVLQIALGCGFASGPHFSNAYRAHFGRTPREERSPRAAAWRAEGGHPPPATEDSHEP